MMHLPTWGDLMTCPGGFAPWCGLQWHILHCKANWPHILPHGSDLALPPSCFPASHRLLLARQVLPAIGTRGSAHLDEIIPSDATDSLVTLLRRVAHVDGAKANDAENVEPRTI
eukprot:CAMPEP_0174289362 /NCGR_PEP_ID=MMETSP0809-20121228/24746_1 /TAXON_ID=73025 ORGANISM="Eutreptiella gymnastica-like, Strain CCMP1594" /NCGR_SAMPLE_ID=MMETSP0809 /ASSEMBLY_ACC=CAM_ASM_000658 /LENGTH=113 /DNA_ID=CAMNT_0015387265 /DNA_START=872 /DNA_END=1210 /DNA_ORIENTATION=-